MLKGMRVAPDSYGPLTDVVKTAQWRVLLARLARATAARASPSQDTHFARLLGRAQASSAKIAVR
jgi:hypothetical protein